jgi:hypothetical protein
MSACIVFIRKLTLDESRGAAHSSSVLLALGGRSLKVLARIRRRVAFEGLEINRVVVAEVPALVEAARAWCKSPADQAAAHRQCDSWLADMEYCDRF